MEKKFMTKEERETVSNRLVLNFGVLLAGGLLLLYCYNFINAGYARNTMTVCGYVSAIALVLGVVALVLGKIKFEKLFKASPVFFGLAIGAGMIFAPRVKFVQTMFKLNLPNITHNFSDLGTEFTKIGTKAILAVALFMVVYFVIMCIITGITLACHPEQPKEKKQIQHAKKKKRK